jgi:hypothetical protein
MWSQVVTGGRWLLRSVTTCKRLKILYCSKWLPCPLKGCFKVTTQRGGNMPIKLSSTATTAVKKNIALPVFDYEKHLSDAMHSIDICPMDVSRVERRRSYELEDEIHNAWGENRQQDFIRLVDEWRRIFDGIPAGEIR